MLPRTGVHCPSLGAAAWKSPSARPSRASALVAAAQRGERVVITRRGEPAAELVACLGGHVEETPQGDFFARLDAARQRLGITAMPPEEARAFRAALHDSALSRRLLGVD